MKKYLIIGNSIAAQGAVEGIRLKDEKSEITVVAKENYPTYSRPLISYYLEGVTSADNLFYKGKDYFAQKNALEILGDEAVKIDSKNKSVALKSGKTLDYDELLIATGSKPFVPPIKGLEKVKDKHTFYFMSDCLELEKSLDKNKKALIIGAGLIGLKCAEGIVDKVQSVTVADLQPKVLPNILNDEAAEIVKVSLENHGFKFLLGAGISELTENKAIFTDGNFVEFDILVLALGVRPVIELFTELDGAKFNKGIIVDSQMKTSISSIYAAGDCAEGQEVSFGEKRLLQLFPSAYLGGKTAGLNMAGEKVDFTDDLAVNSTRFYDTQIMTSGKITSESFTDKTCGYKKLFTENGLLKGYILVNDCDSAGIYTKLIREAIPLKNIDTKLIFDTPKLSAFTKEYRENMLGGKL